MHYDVSVEINGNKTLVGHLQPAAYGEASFQYDPDYFSQNDAAPISIHLPLQTGAFSVSDTRCFFDGLLPEGFTRKSVAQCLKADESDYLSILHGLGKECLGAIQVVSKEDAIEPEAYILLTQEQVTALAAEGASYSASMVSEAHLSLTGATGKVGLYLDESSGNWFLPKGTSPSTHIVKQSHVRYENIVINEYLCQHTAELLGIHVPRTDIWNTGNGTDDEILLISRRYDRCIPEQARKINGLPCPQRIHQEDFAQALGIPSLDKYEQDPEQHYLRRMGLLLRQYSSDPIIDLLKLWDAVAFNFLIGNADAHVKNFSLLYSTDLKTVRLAPLYDTVSTSVYGDKMRKLSFFIGGENTLDSVSRESFQSAAKDLGLGEAMAMKRFDSVRVRLHRAIDKASSELVEKGFPQAEKLRDDILRTGGIARI